MKNLPLYLLAFLILLVTSCKKDEAETPPPANPKPCFLSKAKTGTSAANATPTAVYLYDSNNKLTRVNSFTASGTASNYSTYVYGSNGKVSRANTYTASGNMLFYVTYEYNAGNYITKSTDYAANINGTFESQGHFMYQYNSANRLLKKLHFPAGNPTLSDYYLLFEYDTNGNITRQQRYGTYNGVQVFESSRRLEYDNKKNPLRNLGTAPVVPEVISVNNITKSTIQNASNVTDQNLSRNHVYTYNEHGYPLQETSTNFNNSNTAVYVYEYNCN